ncbi:hypothetical protein [Streptomyces sp. NPDC025273]|uniref:hypothetical protein n=1 Tax=unclassified Streptomyces TaxID=2593676 RepID=UPI0033DDC0A3
MATTAQLHGITEVSAKTGSSLIAGPLNRFQCVADLQRRYGVKRLCSILGVSCSSFYYRRRTAADRAARQAADARLAARESGDLPRMVTCRPPVGKRR